MKNSNNTQNKKYTKLYDLSKEYVPSKLLRKIGLTNVGKKEIANFFQTLLFFLLSFPASLLISYFFRYYQDKSPVYIFYIILVALAGSFFGAKIGLLFALVLLFESFYTFSFNSFNLSNSLSSYFILQGIFFIAGAVIVILLIDWLRNAKEIDRLKRQQKEYAESFIKLFDEYEKVKKDVKARDEFLSVVSHELRTPLTTMLLKLHNMLDNIRHVSLANFSIPELMKVLKNSEIQIKRLTLIINDLLDVSLITTGRMHLTFKKMELVAITRRVVSFSDAIRVNHSKINIEAPSPVRGFFDSNRIEQAITNLISNAIKYGEGKPIKIGIFEKNNFAQIIIEDKGVGIPKEDQNMIFDLFKRADWSKGQSNGLGVGLYVTNKIIEAHRGKMKLSSSTNKGSTFTIELPLNNQGRK